MMQGFKEKINYNEKEFTLQLITTDYVYYCDIYECDNNSNTIILDRKGNILSDNIFAYDSLIEELQSGEWEYIKEEILQLIDDEFRGLEKN